MPEIRHDQPDDIGRAAAQTAGGDAGRIAHFLDYAAYGGGGLRRHVVFVVEDARNGGDRDSGPARHITDRHSTMQVWHDCKLNC